MFMRRCPITVLILLLVVVSVSCGSAGCISGSRDEVTRELVTDGPVQEAWLQSYREGVGFGGEALALDNVGNVYASGNGGFTVKYDGEGGRVWAAPYDGGAIDLVLDIWNNVYVSGSAEGNASWDFVTTKYDNDGRELWTTRYDGQEHRVDCARAMVVDSFGNVYVTGYSDCRGSGEDYATVKYDTNGHLLWTARYDGPSSSAEPYGPSDDWPSDIALDASGNVYVTGDSPWLGASEGYATVKYDADGHELWVRRHETHDANTAAAMIIDRFGDVYVTGTAGTIKYNSSGEQIWLDRIRGTGLATDDTGNIYVVGDDLEYTNRSHIAKYNNNGDRQWNAWADRWISAVAVDASGNLYVAGQDCSIAKYDSSGVRVWAVMYLGIREGSSGSFSGRYNAIAVDASGNAFVAGQVLVGVGSPGLLEENEHWYYAFAVGKYTDNV